MTTSGVRPQLSILSYGGISGASFKCFLRDRAHDGTVPWKVSVPGGDAAVDRQRSLVASEFFKDPSVNVLLMIDHDIGWAMGDAHYIVEEAYKRKAMVGGLVSKRGIGIGYGARLIDGKRHEIGSDEVLKLEDDAYVGGAFLAIHRDVFEKMTTVLPYVDSGQWWPFFLPQVRSNPLLDNRGEYLSEDWSANHWARLGGAEVFLAFKPQLTHHGKWAYNTVEANTAPVLMAERDGKLGVVGAGVAV